MPAPGEDEPGYFAHGRVTPELVETLFTASDSLFGITPWTLAGRQPDPCVDIPALGVNGAVVLLSPSTTRPSCPGDDAPRGHAAPLARQQPRCLSRRRAASPRRHIPPARRVRQSRPAPPPARFSAFLPKPCCDLQGRLLRTGCESYFDENRDASPSPARVVRPLRQSTNPRIRIAAD